ncbi:MAG: polysaccharide deacetylase family protein [Clostridia bacterium]|jgi:biofilm PGA synthesis lipoprotein PgaB|nr:polysaccharide deacetylase family protein [Clostridia bacterium]
MKIKPLLLVLLMPAVFLFGCGVEEEEGIYYRDGVAVLMYHHLDEEESPSTISPARFAAQMEMLEKEGFNVISLAELGAFLSSGGEVPPNAVVITFDDGYASVYHHAFPVLREKRIPAAVFMIVSRVGNTENEIPKLTWAMMEEMQASGISIQSHTYDSHHYVAVNEKGDEKPALAARLYDPATGRRETEQERKDRIFQDLLQSKNILENQLGSPVEYLAVPYGWFDELVVETAREAGFCYLLTIKSGINTRKTDPFHIYRINAGSPKISPEDLKKAILKAAS